MTAIPPLVMPLVSVAGLGIFLAQKPAPQQAGAQP